MRRHIGLLMMMAGAVAFESTAGASGGSQYSRDVTILRPGGTGNPWTASGALGSARNEGNPPVSMQKDIGCRVDNDVDIIKATCTARTVNAGVQDAVECVSSDSRFIQAILAMNGDSLVTFEAFATTPPADYPGYKANDCTSISVENASSYAPK